MKSLTLLVCCGALAVFGQTAPTAATPLANDPAAAKPAATPDTVILKVAGKPMTVAEYDKLLATLPPDVQTAIKSNPKQYLQSLYLVQSLAKQAEQEKLDKTSPVKESLEMQRMQVLAAAIVNRQSASIKISDEDAQKRYEAEKDSKFGQAKIRAIFVHYADAKTIKAQPIMTDAKSPQPDRAALRSEAESKAIADDILKQLKAGGDFADLAKSRSDDTRSGAQGGVFPMIHQADRIPEDFKKAVFALKPGETSEVIRQPNGFYVVRLEERGVQPFAEVKPAVENEIRQERFQQWMAEAQKQFEVSIEDPAFFGARATPAPSLGTRPAPAGTPAQ